MKRTRLSAQHRWYHGLRPLVSSTGWHVRWDDRHGPRSGRYPPCRDAAEKRFLARSGTDERSRSGPGRPGAGRGQLRAQLRAPPRARSFLASPPLAFRRAGGPAAAAGDGRPRTPPGRERKRRAPPPLRERLPEAALVPNLGAGPAPPSRRGAAAVQRAEGQRGGASQARPRRRLLSAGGRGAAATFPPPSGRRGPMSLTLPRCGAGAAFGAPPRPLREARAWDGAGRSR